MTTWQSITDFVREMRAADRPHRPPLPELRHEAGRLAYETYGDRVLDPDLMSLVNIAALTVLMRPRLVVHQITPGAASRVLDTDLHTLPGDPPRLLQGPWIVEVKRPGREKIFEDTASLAGYPLDGTIFLIGLQWPDGVRVVKWSPVWGAQDLAAGVPPDVSSPLIDNVDAHHEWAVVAARFALLLGLHLEAEGSPVAVAKETPAIGPKKSRRSITSSDWIVRRVGLREPLREAEAGGHGEGTAPAGRIPTAALVRGHLKRQPWGPGKALRKWIYVDSYEARRWVSPKPLKLIVS